VGYWQGRQGVWAFASNANINVSGRATFKTIRVRSMKYLAVSLLLFAVNASALELSGTARLRDGKPASLGTIIVTELIQKQSQMPSIGFRRIASTDRYGAFSIKLPKVRGDLHITLVDDHCGWRSGYLLLQQEKFKGKRKISVEVIAVADERCQQGEY
jgi:hypothetical protein